MHLRNRSRAHANFAHPATELLEHFSATRIGPLHDLQAGAGLHKVLCYAALTQALQARHPF